MPNSSPPLVRVNTTLLLLVLAVACSCYALMMGAITPALPQFQREFDTTINGAGWIVTAMLLSASISAPVIGKLGDPYGKKRVLIGTLIIFAAGTALSAVAPTLEVMILGRVLQGVGGGLFPLAFAIVREILPRERVAGAIGILSATLGIGGGFGMVGAGLVVRYLDSSFLFWIPLIPMIAAILLLMRYLPADDPNRNPGSINWLGAILLAISLTALLVAISQGRTWGWTSSRILGLFVVAIIAGILWVQAELRAKEPLVSIPIMRLRGVWTSNLVALLIGIGNFGSFVVTSQLLQIPKSTGFGFGQDAFVTGLILLPAAMMMLTVGMLIGGLERRFGARLLNIVGAAIATVGFSLLALAHDRIWQILIANAVLGIGIGLVYSAIAGVVVLSVPREHVGPASGMNTVLRTLGSSIGSAIPGSILAGSAVATDFPTNEAFTHVYWLVAGIVLLCTFAAALIPKPQPQPQGSVPATTSTSVVSAD